jgi:methylated-DNA-[protein]-cysteine S-methyltransferase
MPTELNRIIPSPVGALLLRAHHDRLTGLVILADPVAASQAAAACHGYDDEPGSPVLQQAVEQLGQYFAGHRHQFRLPLDLDGLPSFTSKVLEVLQTVPFGATLTYGDLAAKAGSPLAARAVGQVMAANPLPIMIPCHRVVAAGGRLGGYSGGGGGRTKEWLLAFERDNCRGNQADFQEKPLDSRCCHLVNRGPHFG